MNIINNKYHILELIGRGKFGQVYKGLSKNPWRNEEDNQDIEDNYVAIKIEKNEHNINILMHEASILYHLYSNGCRCIPTIFYYGSFDESPCLVMSYYKMSLDDYIKTTNIDINKLNSIMVKCIHIIEMIHKYMIIHRDIKPQNFMINSYKELFLIDFGLSIPCTTTQITTKDTIIGTPKYISYYVHDGFECMYRDDMISLGYVYMWFLFKTLPWEKLPACNNPDNIPEISIMHPHNTIRHKMKSFKELEKYINNYGTVDTKKILSYMDNCYKLDFNDRPLYNDLKKIFLQKD